MRDDRASDDNRTASSECVVMTGSTNNTLVDYTKNLKCSRTLWLRLKLNVCGRGLRSPSARVA